MERFTINRQGHSVETKSGQYVLWVDVKHFKKELKEWEKIGKMVMKYATHENQKKYGLQYLAEEIIPKIDDLLSREGE